MWHSVSKVNHTGLSKGWFCVTFFSDKARLQKSRQAILCYFVCSHLRSYLYRILIMLFSNGSSYSKYLFFRPREDFLSPQSSAFHYPDQASTETAFMLLRQNCVFPQLIFLVFRGQTSLGLAEVLVWSSTNSERCYNHELLLMSTCT